MSKHLDICPVMFEEAKCLFDGVVVFLHKIITFHQQKIDSTLNNVGAKCVTQNHKIEILYCQYFAFTRFLRRINPFFVKKN